MIYPMHLQEDRTTLVYDIQLVQRVIIDKVCFVYSGVSRDSVKEYIHYVMTELMQHGFEQ